MKYRQTCCHRPNIIIMQNLRHVMIEISRRVTQEEEDRHTHTHTHTRPRWILKCTSSWWQQWAPAAPTREEDLFAMISSLNLFVHNFFISSLVIASTKRKKSEQQTYPDFVLRWEMSRICICSRFIPSHTRRSGQQGSLRFFWATAIFEEQGELSISGLVNLRVSNDMHLSLYYY